jgi:agmatine/peptidylarginine deiminase
MKRFFYAFILCIWFNSIFAQIQTLPKQMTEEEKALLPYYQIPHFPDERTDPPPYLVRTMAEWEELHGIMITWTSFQSILAQIVDHAQEECTVYVVCADSNTVKNYLTNNSIPLHNIQYLVTNYNSIWIRDYGPWTAYSEQTDSLNIIDWIYNRPRPFDDVIPGIFANLINAPYFATTTPPNDLVHSGGNFMTDGHGLGFSSKLILQENPGKLESDIDTIMSKFMGIHTYIKMNVLPYDVIHHIDMHMKLLDEETLLVGEYPPGVSDGPDIEANLAYILNNFKTCYGRDFKVVRIPMPPDQLGKYPSNGGDYRTYTNSMIVNKTVIIPTYEFKHDTTAFRIYREAMPGYNIVGIDCNSIVPLLGTIHCIVKEVGADHPIFISHAPLGEMSDTCQSYPIIAKIQTSSGVQQADLYWSTDTSIGFNSIPMFSSGHDTFYADIPGQSPGSIIYYFISVKSNLRKTMMRPITAPAGSYQFPISLPTPLDSPIQHFIPEIVIHPNYPNPFNPSTTIEFSLNFAAQVELGIYNSLGEKVTTLHKGRLRAGIHRFTWHAKNLGSGIYFYKITTQNFRKINKVMLLK